MVCNVLTAEFINAAGPLPAATAGPKEFVVGHFFSTVLKIAAASLVVGAVLTFFNINASDILDQVGLSPMQLWIYLNLFIDWATPNIILGSFIVVPIWLLIYLFRPPRA